MPDWTREDELVAEEIASASRYGKTITGRKIAAVTGLKCAQVLASLHKLAEAGLISFNHARTNQ